MIKYYVLLYFFFFFYFVINFYNLYSIYYILYILSLQQRHYIRVKVTRRLNKILNGTLGCGAGEGCVGGWGERWGGQGSEVN